MSNYNFRFIQADGTSITASFQYNPINYPIPNGLFRNIGDVITMSQAPATQSIPDNTYKIEQNTSAVSTLESNDTWYVSGSGGQWATFSGSVISSSMSTVYFDLEHSDTSITPISFSLFPLWRNVLWQYNNTTSLVRTDSLNYVTSASGAFTASLLSMPYRVQYFGYVKWPKEKIWPTASCNVNACAVTGINVSQVITPLNNSLYAYTAQASDLRYILANDSGSSISASYANTSSYTTMYPDITDVVTTHNVGIEQSNPQFKLDVNGFIGDSNGVGGYIDPNNNYLVSTVILTSPSIDWQNRLLLDTLGDSVIDWQNYNIRNGENIITIDWDGCNLYDGSDLLSENWQNRQLIDAGGQFVAVNWGNRTLTNNANVTTLDWQNQTLKNGVWGGSVSTASLASTASYANKALSASYAPSSGGGSTVSCSWASQSLQALYATQSLYATSSLTASSINFVPLTSVSASWVSASAFITTAQTASYVTASNIAGTVKSASYSISASHALTASYVFTASYSPVQLPDITDNTSTHKIGIDTTNPQQTLDVNGNIGTYGNLVMEGQTYTMALVPAGGFALDLAVNSANAGGNNPAGEGIDFYIDTRGANGLFVVYHTWSNINVPANAGIQTTPLIVTEWDTVSIGGYSNSPDNTIATLAVQASSVNTLNVPCIITINGSSQTADCQQWQNSSNVVLSAVLNDGTITNAAGGNDYRIGVGTSENYLNGNGGGFVGIGLTVPVTTLDVNGDISNSTSAGYYIGSSNDSYFNFGGGNLGIGNDAPASKLDVSGDINFTGNLYQNGNSYTASLAITASVQSQGFSIPIIQAGSASVSGTSKIITFAKTMPNTHYVVMLTGESALTTPSAAGKTVSGFTASYATYTGNLDWLACSSTQ